MFLMLFPSGAAEFLAPVTIEYLMMCEGGIIFATLHSRYAQELCKLDAPTMYVRQYPFSYQLKSSKEQLVVKEKHFVNASAILRNKAVLVKAAKSAHCHGGYTWSAQSSSLTVQLTFNVCPPHLSRQS